MNDLIKKYEALLQAPITPENILELKKVLNEIKTHKEIHLTKIQNPRLEYLEGRIEWRDIYKSNDTVHGCCINLVVLDKESLPEIKGFKKYSLGYALDSTKPQEGENLVKVLEAVSQEDFKADSIVVAKVSGVTPVKNGKFYTASINSSPLSLTAGKERLHTAKEIIRKAFQANVLEMDKALAIDLCKTGILTFDIDKHFGVSYDKEIRFCKKEMTDGVVYGIVYPVNEVDSDGDYATPLEVQKAAWRFMEDYQKFNYMHDAELSARDIALVESATALVDAPELGIKKGDWYIAVKVHNDKLKKQIESGEITGFSMEGSAQPGTPIEGMARR